MTHIMIVDNDPLQCRAIELAINKLLAGFRVSKTTSGKEAIDIMNSEKGEGIDLLLLDLSMPEVDGMQVLKSVKKKHPSLPVIINTAYGNVEKAVEALREGACDFIEKQDDPQRIKSAIEKALKISTLEHEVARLNRAERGQLNFSDVIGNGHEIEETKKLAAQAARSNISVLIKGESGVGKELFARAIHGASTRAGKAFVPVNCGAIPENLVESLLFGHEKGSFTGAVEKTIGKFREADGGTLFLDEVGELKPDMQVKLLRVLQQGEVEPVGAGKPVEIDVRLISATNRNLKQAVAEGKFREDLYYRLNVFPITIPPLKERKDDISTLLDHFCKTIAASENKKIKGLSDEARALLNSYDWPGNIRQLQNAVYRAVVLSEKEILDVSDFSHILGAVGKKKALAAQKPSTSENENSISLAGADGEFREMQAIEKEVITKALTHYNWSIAKVSRILGLGRSTLYRKMEEYNIKAKEEVS